VPPGSNAGQRLHETALAAHAPPPVAINLKPALQAAAVQVPDPALVPALAAEAIASAARARLGPLFGLKEEPHFQLFALNLDSAVSRKR
jgi:hypothetical protein